MSNIHQNQAQMYMLCRHPKDHVGVEVHMTHKNPLESNQRDSRKPD